MPSLAFRPQDYRPHALKNRGVLRWINPTLAFRAHAVSSNNKGTTPMTYHAAVWIDHQEAKVFHLAAHEVEKDDVHNGAPAHHIHRKADHLRLGKTPLEPDFMKQIAESLVDARAILIAGPGQARTALMSFLEASYPAVAANVWDNQPMDHPTDAQIVAKARTYFAGADRMRRQTTH
ncbi:MAG: hypothetical protein ACOH2L_18885 [Devosia sp.]